MKVRFLIIAGVILASLGALAYASGGEKSHSVLVVDTMDVAANPERYAGREIRMRGFVKTGSVLRMGDRAEFIVNQEEHEVAVYYDGSTQLPDTFADGAPVRVDGHLDANGRLVSNKVEAKCASKYEAEHAGDYAPGAAPYAGSQRAHPGGQPPRGGY